MDVLRQLQLPNRVAGSPHTTGYTELPAVRTGKAS